MNVVLDKKKKSGSKGVTILLVSSVFVAVASTLFLRYVSEHPSFPAEPSTPAPLLIPDVDPVQLAICSIALEYGVPVEPMIRFAKFLEDNHFNETYGGIGLFSIKPSHLDWIKDKVLQDTVTDLKDYLQNTQVASYLLKRYNNSGYSWEESFLIYTYGFEAVHEKDKHAAFIQAVFNE